MPKGDRVPASTRDERALGGAQGDTGPPRLLRALCEEILPRKCTCVATRGGAFSAKRSGRPLWAVNPTKPYVYLVDVLS